MSSERAHFKAMGQLIAERRAMNQTYYDRSEKLVREALIQFMDDHPEVSVLRFDPTATPIYMAVDQGEGFFEYRELVESNPKLAVCLATMVSHFSDMKDIVQTMFSEKMDITHENVQAIAG